MTETLSAQLIRHGEYRSMTWKNGLGLTREIQIEPATATFPSDPFLWRLSSATISGTNDFSSFPGYDRILVVWKGAGLKLNQSQEMEPFVPYHFHGEDAVHCELIDPNQPVIDYGIIYRQQSTKATMTISSAHNLCLPPGTHYFTVIEGSFKVEGNDLEASDGDTLVFSVSESQGSNVTLISIDNSNIKYFYVHLQNLLKLSNKNSKQ